MRVELRLSVIAGFSCCSFIGRENEQEREGTGEGELNFIHQKRKRASCPVGPVAALKYDQRVLIRQFLVTTHADF